MPVKKRILAKNRVDYSAISKPVKEEPAAVASAEVEKPKEVPAEKPVKVSVTKKGRVVDCSALNVRLKPSSDAGITTIVPIDTELTISGESGDFYKVVTGNGIGGYAMKRFVKVQ